MPQKIIDLRTPATQENNRQQSPSLFLEWSTYEYPAQSRIRPPLTLLGIGACILIALGIFTKNYFFIAFILIACAVAYMYAKRAPRMLSCAIVREGIHIQKKLHPFSEIESFWIFEYPEGNELSLILKKGLNRLIRMPLGNISPERVRLILRPLLTEKEQEEFISDQIARSIGF